VFTEPLPRSGLHKLVVPPLLGADYIENTASSIVACWTVFTELLPGNVLINYVTIYSVIQIFSHLGVDRWMISDRIPRKHSVGVWTGFM
jgi:hypothetical protein